MIRKVGTGQVCFAKVSQRTLAMLPTILFWAGMLLLAFGFIDNALWRFIAKDPTVLLGELALVSVAASYVLKRLLRCYFATAMLGVWLIALVCFAGFASSVAVLLIAAATMGVGSCFIPADWPARAALSTLVGMALIAGIVGWTLPFHIRHIHAVYIIGLTILVAWRARELVGILKSLPSAWSSAVAAAPVAAGLATITLGVASTFAWLPTILYDELVYHLALPSQLAHLGYYRMDAASNVWALAAWSSDVLQAMAWVVAGRESRGVVDALWFTLSAVLLWRLCKQLELKPALRWVAIALVASAPIVAYTMASMQSEGPTIAVILALAVLIQWSRSPSPCGLLVAATLFGFLLGLKVSNLWFALPLGAWCLWQWRGRLPWVWLPSALLLVFVAAGSSYSYAYVLTGNPVLPLYNGIFHSPFFPSTNFFDARWHSGFGWDIVWRLVFHSATFIEGAGVVAPLALIGLGGCFFVALMRPRSRPLALVAGVAFLLPLSVIQYLRYATPGLALLIPVMLCGLPSQHEGRWLRGLSRSVSVWALVFLSLAFLSGAAWQLQGGALKTLLARGVSGVFAEFAPTRSISQTIRSRYGGTARTLILDSSQPFAAELDGRAFATAWYDPQLQGLADRHDVTDGQKWMRLFDLTGANLVVTRGSGMAAGVPEALRAADAALVDTVNGEDLWELHLGQDGTTKVVANHGILVTFDTTDAPMHHALVHGEIDLACDFRAAAKTHIVVGWLIVEADGEKRERNEWAQCTPSGRAHAAWDLVVSDRVTVFTVQVQPDPVMDVGLKVLASRGSLRNNLTAQRDLARRLRYELAFWKEPKHPTVGSR